MVKENLIKVKSTLPERVKLIAVSKFHPVEAIQEAYEVGQRDFGESRAQELVKKAPLLPCDINWHFIGHLQTNKVRQIIPYVSMIQSVDSFRLLKAIDEEARKADKSVDILLQIHVAEEETKTGFLPSEMEEAALIAKSMDGVKLRGVMGMATNTDDESRIRSDFKKIKACFDSLSTMLSDKDFDTLSIGMSDDRSIAVDEGSTMVRVGTDIFGHREY